MVLTIRDVIYRQSSNNKIKDIVFQIKVKDFLKQILLEKKHEMHFVQKQS